MSHDNYLRTGITALRETVHLSNDLIARQTAFDDDEVGRWALLVMCDRRLDAAHVHTDVRLGEPPILRSDLHEFRSGRILAKGLDRYARYGTRTRARRFLDTFQICIRRREIDPLDALVI